MKNDLIICDWSGTLSDDFIPVCEANNIMLMKYGLFAMDFKSFLKNSSKSIFEFYRERGIDLEKDAVLRDFCQFFEHVNQKGIVPRAYDDSSEFLEELNTRNKLLAVVSSHPEKFVLREVENYGFRDFFDVIRGSVYDKVRGIQEIIDKFEVVEERTVYIGDTTYDMEAAQRAEVQGVALCRGYHSREILEKVVPKERIFDNLIEVLDSGILGN